MWSTVLNAVSLLLEKKKVQNGLFLSHYTVPSMPRNGVVFPQPEAEVSFPSQDILVNLQSFGAISHSCAAHRSQSEAKMLSGVKFQAAVCAK